MPLAVQCRHERRGVPLAAAASAGTARSIAARSAGVRLASGNAPSASVEPIPPSGAHQRHDIRAAREHPRDRDLRDRGAPRLRNPAQFVHEPQVVVDVVGGKAGP